MGWRLLAKNGASPDWIIVVVVVVVDVVVVVVGVVVVVFGTGSAIRPDNPLQRPDAQVFSLQLLPMDVEDAEGLDSEPAGEDRTCGKGRQGTFNDIKERDGSEHRKDDADSFHAEIIQTPPGLTYERETAVENNVQISSASTRIDLKFRGLHSRRQSVNTVN